MKRYGRVTLIEGDITRIKVDVMVNAANRYLRGGGGVDGMIRAAGGKVIKEECQKSVANEGECPSGKVRITSGGGLPCKYVFHAVGPIWTGGKQDEDYLLKKCYATSLDLAYQKKAISIAFPSISTGSYGFPKNKAAVIAISEVKRFLSSMAGDLFKEIAFVLYDGLNYSLYEQILNTEASHEEKWY